MAWHYELGSRTLPLGVIGAVHMFFLSFTALRPCKKKRHRFLGFWIDRYKSQTRPRASMPYHPCHKSHPIHTGYRFVNSFLYFCISASLHPYLTSVRLGFHTPFDPCTRAPRSRILMLQTVSWPHSLTHSLRAGRRRRLYMAFHFFHSFIHLFILSFFLLRGRARQRHTRWFSLSLCVLLISCGARSGGGAFFKKKF